MKKQIAFTISIAIFHILILTSCTVVYFDKPQPIDSNNIPEFPEEYRGQWVGMQDFDTITIEKKYLSIAQHNKIKIAKNVADSSDSYIITENKIYEKINNKLEGGYNYILKDDTIYAEGTNYIEYNIGSLVKLRKANQYLLANYREENLFWITIYIQKNSDGSILIRSLDDDDLKTYLSTSKLKQLYSQNGNYYYEAVFLKEDIIEIIENNGFSDTLAYLKSEYKIR